MPEAEATISLKLARRIDNAVQFSSAVVAGAIAWYVYRQISQASANAAAEQQRILDAQAAKERSQAEAAEKAKKDAAAKQAAERAAAEREAAATKIAEEKAKKDAAEKRRVSGEIILSDLTDGTSCTKMLQAQGLERCAADVKAKIFADAAALLANAGVSEDSRVDTG